MANTGKVKQIIGPVVDVSFDTAGSVLPKIMDALEVTRDNGQKVILEVQQHLGEDSVRTVAMDPSERLLDLLSDPNLGLILMTIAIYGIIFELSNPGAILPGVIGAIALVLALGNSTTGISSKFATFVTRIGTCLSTGTC